MKLYVKEIDNKQIYKTRSEIVISKNDMNIYNPTEEMILADGWLVYEPKTESPIVDNTRTFESVLNTIIERINEYDLSDKVNIFYVKGMPIWLDKITRSGLMLRFNAELESAMVETSLWYEGIEFPLLLDDAVKMLYAIEVYASKCYDNTQRHIKNVKSLTTIEELESYDYTAGYPEYLNF